MNHFRAMSSAVFVELAMVLVVCMVKGNQMIRIYFKFFCLVSCYKFSSCPAFNIYRWGEHYKVILFSWSSWTMELQFFWSSTESPYNQLSHCKIPVESGIWDCSIVWMCFKTNFFSNVDSSFFFLLSYHKAFESNCLTLISYFISKWIFTKHLS